MVQKRNNSNFKIPDKEKVFSWGMTSSCEVPVFRPESERELAEIFQWAKKNKTSVTLRGSGCSYGDASLNSSGVLVDITYFNQILSWDKKKGLITVQSGATIQKIWEFVISEGYWPPVVSGTMMPTIGGALGMNIHGKNNYFAGTLGDSVNSFRILTGSGKIVKCSPVLNKELFYSAISGFGMFGCILDVTIKMKKIYSGKMHVVPVATKNIGEMIQYFEDNYKTSDYLVGWIDAFPGGKASGRGLIHKADNLKPGEDSEFPENCQIDKQNLPDKFFGIVPKSWMWVFLKPFTNNLGMRLINFAKFIAGKILAKPYFQGHAEYAFLLDYVPNWKFIYKPGGLIQYQSFIPKKYSEQAFNEILSICRKNKIYPYLAVFKKHKPDKFLFSNNLDGYSLALDFPVTDSNKSRLWKMTEDLNEVVIRNDGKFYFAKDSTLTPQAVRRAVPDSILKKFKGLKKKYDPSGILTSDLYRRLFQAD